MSRAAEIADHIRKNLEFKGETTLQRESAEVVLALLEQADVRQDGGLHREVIAGLQSLKDPRAGNAIRYINALASQAPSEASGNIPCEPFRLESDVDEDGFMTNPRIVPAPSEASSGVERIVAYEDCLNCSCPNDRLCNGTQPRHASPPPSASQAPKP
jgi:hypothetical protein